MEIILTIKECHIDLNTKEKIIPGINLIKVPYIKALISALFNLKSKK